MSGIPLTSQQAIDLNAIYVAQSALPAHQQDWSGAYALIANAIQGLSTQQQAQIEPGVIYFFQNAGDVNLDGATASNYFTRTAYTVAAALQGVTLSSQQVQAVSGNIGLNIFASINGSGEIPTQIKPIIDTDVKNAVTNIPGVTTPLSFATWGAAAFAENKLGYDGFYSTYFTGPLDWQIFYTSTAAACIGTGYNFPSRADSQSLITCGAALTMVSLYLSNYPMAVLVQDRMPLMARAAELAWNSLNEFFFGNPIVAAFPELVLNALIYGNSEIVNGNLVVDLQAGNEAAGTLTFTSDELLSLYFGGSVLEFAAQDLYGITTAASDGLHLELSGSQAQNFNELYLDGDGNGILSNSSGTEIDFRTDQLSSVSQGFDGETTLNFLVATSDVQLSTFVDPDGLTSIQLGNGTRFTLPAGAGFSMGGPGLNLPNGGFDNPGAGFGFPDPDSPEDPSAPFEPHHPSPLQKSDPLVFDLDGDGIELVSVENSNAHFDYGGTSFAPKTGWVAASEGILIRDLDQNSSVSAAELFGASSGNAFADLAALDSNTDGKIDSNDAVFADLKMWIDADGDGVGDSGELHSLSSLNIASINLTTTQSGEIVEGNHVVETASFTKTNSTTGTIAEVHFATDALYARYEPASNFQFSQMAFLLPSLVGFGTVPDLIYSMSLDEDLEEEALELVMGAGAMSATEFSVAFEAFIFTWAGVQGIDPESKGPLVNAQHLGFVEAFYGATYEQMNGVGATLNAITASSIEATYQSIVEVLKVRFVAQLPLSQLLNGATWEDVAANPYLPFASINVDSETNNLTVDFDALISSIAAGLPDEDEEKWAYIDKAATIVEALRIDVFDNNHQELVDAVEALATTEDLGDYFEEYFALRLGITHNGTALSETVVAGSGDDIIRGNAGDDIIEDQFGGVDNFLHEAGDGNDTIYSEDAGEADVLRLLGINPSDVRLTRSQSDLCVVREDTGEVITVWRQFEGPTYDYGVAIIRFDNGIEWDRNFIEENVVVEGTSGVDDIYGYASDDTYDALEGDDILRDVYSGEDLFIHRAGSGNDLIYSQDIGESDTLRLMGVIADDVVLARAGDDLIVKRNDTNETITIWRQFAGANYGISQIVFDDETTWNSAYIASHAVIFGTSSADTINTTSGDDIVQGLAGDDIINSAGGSDTFIWGLGDGNDWINEESGSTSEVDTLKFTNVNPDDIRLSKSGNDLIVDVLPTGERIEIDEHYWSTSAYYGIEKIVFANSTAWNGRAAIEANVWTLGSSSGETLDGNASRNLIDGLAGADVINGLGGNDKLNGGDGDDILDGGDGSDELIGGLGSDTASYASRTNGQDINLTTGHAADLADSIAGRYVRIYQVNADWLSLAEVKVFVNGVNVALAGTASQSTTGFGGTAGKAIDGNTDGDFNNGSVTHSGDSSSYNWWQVDLGASYDIDKIEVFNRTDGYGYRLNGFDVVVFDQTPGSSDNYSTVIGYGTASLLQVAGQIGESKAVLDGGSIDTLTGIENVTGSDHADIIIGNAVANILAGAGGNDTINGAGGNDTLTGGSGDDTFVFKAGFGNDTITDFTVGASSDDVIEFHDGLFADINAILAAASTSGSDTLITVDGQNSILLKNVALANLHQDDFRIV